MQKSPEFQKKDCFLIRAPLATFDTIDLGDDLPKKPVHSNIANKGCNKDSVEETNISVRNDTCSCVKEEDESVPETVKIEKPSPKREFLKFDKKKDSARKDSPKLDKKKESLKKDSPKPDKRKGSPKKESKAEKSKLSSKKELSKAEKKKDKDNKKSKSNTKLPEKSDSVGISVLPESGGIVQNSPREARTCGYDYEKETDNYVYIRHEPFIPSNASDNISHEQINSYLSYLDGEGKKVETVFIPPPLALNRNIPQLQRTASFSSSSSESDSEVSRHTKNLRARKNRVKENEHAGGSSAPSQQSPLTLSPELVDPTSITSPSKRKAYQKRLRRQQVKTSPIARPRSTTPISVVTLDEYTSVLSSPENSPLSPSLHLGDKLKITLPADEFSFKSKSARTVTNLSLSSEDNEESVFEFNEEHLFCHTRSALVVDESGNIPSSPRRVLIPPTISPSSSPQLAAANLANSEDSKKSPRLLYYQSKPEVCEEENWACFSDYSEQVSLTQDTTISQDLPKPIYATEELDLPGEDDILTINISNTTLTSGFDIDIVLSSSSSSTSHPSPSTPVKPESENIVTYTDSYDLPVASGTSTPLSDNIVTDSSDVPVPSQTSTPDIPVSYNIVTDSSDVPIASQTSTPDIPVSYNIVTDSSDVPIASQTSTPDEPVSDNIVTNSSDVQEASGTSNPLSDNIVTNSSDVPIASQMSAMETVDKNTAFSNM